MLLPPVSVSLLRTYPDGNVRAFYRASAATATKVRLHFEAIRVQARDPEQGPSLTVEQAIAPLAGVIVAIEADGVRHDLPATATELAEWFEVNAPPAAWGECLALIAFNQIDADLPKKS